MTALRSAHFSISVSRALGTVVVTVHGHLDVLGARHLGSILADIIDQGPMAVVVDLHDASIAAYSGGASVFAAMAERASKRGAALSVRNPPNLLYQALMLMGLGRLVRTTRHDDRRPSPSAPFGRIAAPGGLAAQHRAFRAQQSALMEPDRIQSVAEEDSDYFTVALAHGGVDGEWTTPLRTSTSSRWPRPR